MSRIMHTRKSIARNDEKPVYKLLLQLNVLVRVDDGTFAFEHELQASEVVLAKRRGYIELRRGIKLRLLVLSRRVCHAVLTIEVEGLGSKNLLHVLDKRSFACVPVSFQPNESLFWV